VHADGSALSATKLHRIPARAHGLAPRWSWARGTPGT